MALSYGRLRSSTNNPLFDAARLAELVPKLVAQVRRDTSPPSTPLVPSTFLQIGGGVLHIFLPGHGPYGSRPPSRRCGSQQAGNGRARHSVDLARSPDPSESSATVPVAIEYASALCRITNIANALVLPLRSNRFEAGVWTRPADTFPHLSPLLMSPVGAPQ